MIKFFLLKLIILFAFHSHATEIVSGENARVLYDMMSVDENYKDLFEADGRYIGWEKIKKNKSLFCKFQFLEDGSKNLFMCWINPLTAQGDSKALYDSLSSKLERNVTPEGVMGSSQLQKKMGGLIVCTKSTPVTLNPVSSYDCKVGNTNQQIERKELSRLHRLLDDVMGAAVGNALD